MPHHSNHSLRMARPDDYEDIVHLCLEFAYDSTYSDLGVDEDKTRRSVQEIMNAPESVVIVYTVDDQPVGLIAGKIIETLFSSTKIASEIVWWVSPDFRNTRKSIELVRAFEYWAETYHKAPTHMSSLGDEKVNSFYKKSGYAQAETAFIKFKR